MEAAGTNPEASGDAEETLKSRVMRLARELGNVSEACRRLGVDRSVYYRTLTKGQSAKTTGGAPYRKPPELEERLIALCHENPEWGCDRLAYYLTLKGFPVSSPTAQKILIRHGLGRMNQRYEAVRLRNLGNQEGSGNS